MEALRNNLLTRIENSQTEKPSHQTYCYDDSKLLLFQILRTFRQEVITDNVDKPSCGIVLSCQDNINVLWVHRGKPFDKSLPKENINGNTKITTTTLPIIWVVEFWSCNIQWLPTDLGSRFSDFGFPIKITIYILGPFNPLLKVYYICV